MNALTIHQPYAALIMAGEQRVENRTWKTAYRGPLAIHASRSREELWRPAPPDMAFGAVLGIVELLDCLRLAHAHSTALQARYPWLLGHRYTQGPYLWIVEVRERYAVPITARGHQGL